MQLGVENWSDKKKILPKKKESRQITLIHFIHSKDEKNMRVKVKVNDPVDVNEKEGRMPLCMPLCKR